MRGIGIVLMVLGHAAPRFTALSIYSITALFLCSAGGFFFSPHGRKRHRLARFAKRKVTLWLPFVAANTYTLLTNLF